MPRTSETPEARVLKYFEDTPIQVAQMVFGLCAAIVKKRAPVATKKVVRNKNVDKPSPDSASAARISDRSDDRIGNTD